MGSQKPFSSEFLSLFIRKKTDIAFDTYYTTIKMSVVHGINPIPSFQYRGFSIQKEAIGEVPKLNFKIEMSIKPEKTPELTYVYINHLDCEVSLKSTASPEFDATFI